MTWFDWQILFLYFIGYSFLGRVVETIYVSVWSHIKHQKLVHQSFLSFPITPIYGFGCLAILTISHFLPDKTSILFTFLAFAFICGLLEFLTGELFKLIFGKNIWWDYSDHKLQIDGQVCLQNIILFGLGGLFITYLIHPFFSSFVQALSTPTIKVLFWIFLIILVIDFSFSALQYWRSSRGKKILSAFPFKNFKFD